MTAPMSHCVLVLLTNRLSLCMFVALPAHIQSRKVPEKFLVTLPWPPTRSRTHHATTGVSKLRARLTVMWHQPAASTHPSIYSSTGSNKLNPLAGLGREP
jgi:hypothetical protein